MRDARKKGSTQQAPTRLVDILRSLPKSELEALAQRVGATIDKNKRVDAPVQLARVLVRLPEFRDMALLNTAAAQLLRRLGEAGGVLMVRAVPPALEPLAARGVVFVRVHDQGLYELVLPAAYLVQLPSWEGEDPRGARALLAQASHETLSAIASHYTGKPATHPISLALEEAWDVLRSSQAVAAEVGALASAERRLLEAIYKEGGEVDTEELLDLEREPLRLRGATGATPSRRGVGFSLERRGMLIPVHPNRHVIPTEVAAVVGAEDASSREVKRAQIRAFVLDGDHEPRRARFAFDPAPLALALAMAARDSGVEVREGAGTPRSLLQRLAQRFGREPNTVSLIVALSRAVGLWEASALSKATPPGAWTPPDLGLALFRVWRQGGAWDEARPEPEVLRLPPDARDSSPVRVVRDIVLDALEDLGESCWVPFEALADYVRNDPRTPGVTRLLRRWATRVGLEPPTPTDVAQVIVLESLPALGIIDIGEGDLDEDLQEGSPLVRITPRGRAILQGRAPDSDMSNTAFIDDTLLRIGNEPTIAAVLALFPFAEIGKVADVLELDISHTAISRAVASGMEGDLIRAAIRGLTEPSAAIRKALDQLSVVLGRVTYVPASGFLWCDDADVREMLRSRRQTADLFVDPSPPGGLLIENATTIEIVARRCRALGVEVLVEGQVVRARSTIPPAMLDAGPKKRSTRPPRKTETKKSSRAPARPRSKRPAAK